MHLESFGKRVVQFVLIISSLLIMNNKVKVLSVVQNSFVLCIFLTYSYTLIHFNTIFNCLQFTVSQILLQ